MPIFQNDDREEHGKNRSFSPTPEMSSGARSETIVGASVSLEGDFSSEENIVIHGEVRGTVSTKQDLTIGESAKVKADIDAENVTVSGEVNGTVEVQGRLRVTATGRINGDISTKTLVVEEGAEITGACSMGVVVEEEKPLSEFVKREQEDEAKHISEKSDERSSEAEQDVEELLPKMA